MINEPRGALTCRLSTHTVLADSGPFHGLLLTILSRFGVPEQFSRLTIPRVPLRVRRQKLTVLANSNPLCGLLLTFLGS